MFAYYLEKLRNTPDGDGSLLDYSMILYGSNMSSSNLHDHFPLPTVMVGGGAGQLKGNRHLKYADRTPMTNLLMTLLNKLDIPLNQVGGQHRNAGGALRGCGNSWRCFPSPQRRAIADSWMR
jgi:hypothetical protein